MKMLYVKQSYKAKSVQLLFVFVDGDFFCVSWGRRYMETDIDYSFFFNSDKKYQQQHFDEQRLPCQR